MSEGVIIAPTPTKVDKAKEYNNIII